MAQPVGKPDYRKGSDMARFHYEVTNVSETNELAVVYALRSLRKAPIVPG